MAASTLIVTGRMLSADFQAAKAIGKRVSDIARDSLKVDLNDVIDIDWDSQVQQVNQKFGAHVVGPCPNVFIYHSKLGWIGSSSDAFLAWATPRFALSPVEGDPDYAAIARSSLGSYCSANSKDSHFVQMTFESDGNPLGTIVLELFKSIMPKTCDNFRALCTGEMGTSASGTTLHYAWSPIHRIVPNGWIQGGDIATGNGDGGESSFGGLFEDECFAVHHDRLGILSMANDGRPHSNGSQFFITLRDLEYLDRNKVAFGRVISGVDTLRRIAARPTCNERPTTAIAISNCGDFEP